MENYVVAVVGCGRIAQSAHFPAFARLANVRVKYACDLIASKAEAMREKYPDMVENVITDYRVALADPEVEAVYVLTPNREHYTVTMDALRAGKHVFCEKPVAVNYALAREMKEEADRQGKILNIGVCNRYQKSVELLEERNRRGDFGKIYHVNCSFRAFRSIPGLGGAFTDRSCSGGGVLIDWGIHFLDLILYVLGGATIQTVSADTYSEMAKNMADYRYKSMWAEDTKDLNGKNDVEDFVTGHIRTDKATITFTGAWAQNIDRNEMYVDFLGDKGGARLDYCQHFTFYNGETLEGVTDESELPNMYECEDAAFLQAMRRGEKTKANIDNILESMRLLDQLYRSAEQHAELRCDK